MSAASSPSEPKFRSFGWRAGNAVAGVLARAGVGPIQLLTTTGHRTGRSHTNPAVPVGYDGKTWLVAPYGVVAWVTNVRADGRVRLRYGRSSQDFVAREASAEQAGPVLQRYVAVATKTRAQFSATKDSPVAAFIREADRHPVFELVPPSPQPQPSRGTARGTTVSLLHRVTNPFVVALLRSPLHRALSRSVLSLTVQGRRSGRSYTFPVQYARTGSTLYIVPGGHEHKTWWRNLRTPAPVTVRLRGETTSGVAQALDAQSDPDAVVAAMRIYLPRFPSSARLRGLTVAGGHIVEDDASVRHAVARDVIVRIDLASSNLQSSRSKEGSSESSNG